MPLLSDFDPVVAAAAADAAQPWTGGPPAAADRWPVAAASPTSGLELASTRDGRRRSRAAGSSTSAADRRRAADARSVPAASRRGRLLRRADVPPRRAEFRRPGRKPGRERVHAGDGPFMRDEVGLAMHSAARSASPRAAATPATRSSSSTWSTTRGWITTTRLRPSCRRPRWRSWTNPGRGHDYARIRVGRRSA